MTCGISRSSKEQEKQRQYQWVMQDLGCLRWASGNNIWHAEPSIGLWISPSKGNTSAGPAWIVGRCSWEGNWQPGEAGPKGMWKHPQGSRASVGVRRARGANVQLMSSKLDDSCPDWTGSRRTLWKEVKACSRSVSGEHLDLSSNLIGWWFTFPPEEQDYCDLQCQDLWPDTSQRHG